MAEFTKTVNQLIDLVLSRVRSTTGSSAELYNQTLADLNFSLQELATLHSWKWLKKEVTLSVPAGTRLLNSIASYPADAVNFNSLVVSDQGSIYPIYMITESEAREMYPDKTKQGSVAFYMIGPVYAPSAAQAAYRTLELFPLPERTISLEIAYEYTFKPYTSAEGAETPPIPPYYYSALVEMVAARVLRFTKNPRAEIDDARNTSLLMLSQLAKKDADKNKQHYSFRLQPTIAAYRARRYD